MSTKITIVIPCRNEKPFIAECVHAIYACSLPAGTECHVFVVDGRSDDGTLDVLAELQQQYPTLQVVENTKQLTPFAFNLGIYAGGKTDYVQIVGARHILSENYLQRSLEILQSQADTWCVGGRLINEYINEAGETISRAMDTAFGMGIGNFRILEKSGYTDTVTSPMYPYWVFERIGFFDEQLIRNQDDDFNFRVTQAGGKIWFEHAISLRYFVRGNVKGLYRQFYQYGYWKVFVNRKHGAVTTMRQLVPPAFVAFVLFSPLAVLLPYWMGCGVLAVYGLYFFLAIFFGLKKGKNTAQKFKIMGIFPILHFSYGFGYLRGMWEFLLLRRNPSEKQKELTR